MFTHMDQNNSISGNVRNLFKMTKEISINSQDHNQHNSIEGIDLPDSGNYDDSLRCNDVEVDSTHERRQITDNSMSSLPARLATYKTWPISHIIGATTLAMSGFFYTKCRDMVECYACHGKIEKWEDGDDAVKEHKRHFPGCKLVQNIEDNAMGSDEIDSASGGINNTHYFKQQSKPAFNSKQYNRNQIQTARIVDTSRLVHSRLPALTRTLFPQYCQTSAREETFVGWQCHQKPNCLAEAGFFSLGARGETKCFYCGGGLRSWGPNDDPWVEHAKWFPRCDWLIRQKGETFIQSVQKHVLNSGMHNSGNPSDQQNVNGNNHQKLSDLNNNYLLQRKLEEAMLSKLIRQILEMGFDYKLVEDVVKHKLTSTGEVFRSSVDLFDAVMQASEAFSRKEANSKPTSQTKHDESFNGPTGHQVRIPSSGYGSDESSNPDQLTDEELKSTLEELRDRTICKICLDNEACIVFTPCGHLVTCASCYKPLNVCPVCRTEIKSHIKAYLA